MRAMLSVAIATCLFATAAMDTFAAERETRIPDKAIATATQLREIRDELKSKG